MNTSFAARHSRILGTLMMRELTTRFGREGLGFVWLVAEPLAFCFAVILLWSVLKPEYEHGVRLGPFVMTGYMAILLIRHQISYSMGALQANIGLLHHRQISILHLYFSRNILEFGGASIAFLVVYITLLFLGQVNLPHQVLLLYGGWTLFALLGMGTALILAGLSLRYEVLQRLAPLFTYLLLPISGAFMMADWLPENFREIFLLVPYPHAIEMLRTSVFGEFVTTHYDFWYALAWAGVLNFFGMILVATGQKYVDAE